MQNQSIAIEQKASNKEYFTLIFTFFRIGAFTFGGGYAMLPLLQKELVDKYGWITEEELLDYFAVGQSTPGIIAINTATFVGYKRRGVVGALCATMGMVLPSIILISAVAAVFTRISDFPVFNKAFTGIRVVVVALILKSVLKLGKKAISSTSGYLAAAAALASSAFFDVSPVYIILAGVCAGLLTHALNRKVSRP